MSSTNNNELNDDVIVLVDSEGKEVRFEFMDVVEREDKMYAILHPLEELEGVEEDSCVIFEMDVQEDDSVLLNPVESEELLNAVYEQYVSIHEGDCDCEAECEGCSSCKDKE